MLRIRSEHANFLYNCSTGTLPPLLPEGGILLMQSDATHAVFDWPHCAAAVRAQVARYTAAIHATLDDRLLGIYLHGSLAMGCPTPIPKDLDLLLVLRTGMPLATRREIARIHLEESLAPQPLEVHFLLEQDLQRWRHPLPYEMHYSEAWRERFTQHLGDPSWSGWRYQGEGDPDLAAHLTIARARGCALFGPSPAEVFPRVPRADYLSAIRGDVQEAAQVIERDPVYAVLNLCRVYCYLCTGMICSKVEGGDWACQHLEAALVPVVEQALDEYRGGVPTLYDGPLLAAFGRALLQLIAEVAD